MGCRGRAASEPLPLPYPRRSPTVPTRLSSFAVLPPCAGNDTTLPGLDDVRTVGDAIQQRLHSRGFGNTCVHSEKGKFVVTISVALSARSAITWNRTPRRSPRAAHNPLRPVRSRHSASTVPAPPYSMLLAGLDQFIHQIRCRGKPHFPLLTQAATHSPVAKCVLPVPHSRSKPPARPRDVAAFGQFADFRRRNLRRPRELELLQRFHPWQPGLVQPIRDRVPVSFLTFHRSSASRYPIWLWFSFTACSARRRSSQRSPVPSPPCNTAAPKRAPKLAWVGSWRHRPEQPIVIIEHRQWPIVAFQRTGLVDRFLSVRQFAGHYQMPHRRRIRTAERQRCSLAS